MIPAEIDRVSLARVAYDHEIPLADLERVVQIESGWNPQAENPQSHAIGLVQFMPSTLFAWGMNTGQVRAMNAAQQIPLVDKYLKGVSHPIGADAYLAFAYPAAIGHQDDYRIGPAGGIIAQQNPGWRGTDGAVTAGSIRAFFRNAMARPNGPKKSLNIHPAVIVLLALLLLSRRT